MSRPLLGHVEIEKLSIDDILNEYDELLNTDEELSIFKFKNVPHPSERAESDFVAQRKHVVTDPKFRLKT